MIFVLVFSIVKQRSVRLNCKCSNRRTEYLSKVISVLCSNRGKITVLDIRNAHVYHCHTPKS